MVQPATPSGRGGANPPVFNAPKVVVYSAAVLCIIYVIDWLAPRGFSSMLLHLFAFNPLDQIGWAAFFSNVLAGKPVSWLSAFSDAWSFVTHAFLHGGIIP